MSKLITITITIMLFFSTAVSAASKEETVTRYELMTYRKVCLDQKPSTKEEEGICKTNSWMAWMAVRLIKREYEMELKSCNDWLKLKE